jgi:mannose/cellobiose epimerase-like protein (N-acyl-D-glucosamine 2-epimerase family)
MTEKKSSGKNAEMLIALTQACLVLNPEKYWQTYQNVHRFVFDKMIHHEVGEWWPLLTRHGQPIWTHMSHNWKINYHTVRSMIETAKRMELLLGKNNID